MLALTFFFVKINAQELIISSQHGFLKYDLKERTLHALDENKFTLKDKPEKAFYIDQLTYCSDQISSQFRESQGYDFF
jgi:hypothetical protein